jgi:acyl-coenzyme A synthetase/AMP-(fatty) acid ligase
VRWFPDVQLNFAEHILRRLEQGDPERPALIYSTEVLPQAEMCWANPLPPISCMTLNAGHRGRPALQ